MREGGKRMIIILLSPSPLGEGFWERQTEGRGRTIYVYRNLLIFSVAVF
jgi:hypothetical protein